MNKDTPIASYLFYIPWIPIYTLRLQIFVLHLQTPTGAAFSWFGLFEIDEQCSTFSTGGTVNQNLKFLKIL
jgi:hypothetical protein